MKTLKQISSMSPHSYKVVDRHLMDKHDDDLIEIIVDGRSKYCLRKNAYKFGLAEK